ncbi:MAG: hypothetical protein ABUS49_03140 [Acidobacteriota bacterium]
MQQPSGRRNAPEVFKQACSVAAPALHPHTPSGTRHAVDGAGASAVGSGIHHHMEAAIGMNQQRELDILSPAVRASHIEELPCVFEEGMHSKDLSAARTIV